MKTRIVILAAALLASPAAFAQSAKENFSYKAPSGMFGEGTTIWKNYRFMHEDRERMLNGGFGDTTGSIRGGGTYTQTPVQPARRRPSR